MFSVALSFVLLHSSDRLYINLYMYVCAVIDIIIYIGTKLLRCALPHCSLLIRLPKINILNQSEWIGNWRI